MMDSLLVAVGIAWEEYWRDEMYELGRMVQIEEGGLRLAVQSGGPVDYWTKKLDTDKHRLAVLKNVRDALDEARRA
jgi:hypothetical protein